MGDSGTANVVLPSTLKVAKFAEARIKEIRGLESIIGKLRFENILSFVMLISS